MQTCVANFYLSFRTDPMLIRLLYASRAKTDASASEMASILQQSRNNNPPEGITGILCHSSGIYLQVLEGGRASVNALYNRVAKDSRHSDVTILHYEEVSERCFSNWTMGQVDLAKVNPSLMLKYSERPHLDPFAVSGEASMALLKELIATAHIVGRA
jgi:Sensors of blue-light using FAD